MKYECPVCLTKSLHEPFRPNSYEICMMCGVEYGFDDAGTTHEQLREAWLAAGSPNWQVEINEPNFDYGVTWLKQYFSIPENEDRRGEALVARWERSEIRRGFK